LIVQDYIQNEKVATLVMGLGDINLGFSSHHNSSHSELIAGDHVLVEMRGKSTTLCIVHKGKAIGFLSQNFHKKVQQYLKGNYTVHEAVIDFVVLWHNRDTGEDIKHPLCKIVLKNNL